jgi:hypothetical protein
LDAARKQAKKAGIASDDDLEYHCILATLMRLKRKERVPPRHATKLFDFDKMREQRYPGGRGSKTDPKSPPHQPYACKLDCETCFTQHFPVRFKLTDEEALEGVQFLSDAIHDDLRFLRQALQYYADAILTRWRKKSKEKRSSLLSALLPQKQIEKPGEKRPAGTSLFEHNWPPYI